MKLNQKRIKSKIVTFNLTSLFFFLMSCISLTFAWFAYSNVINSSMEIDVAAWNIEISEDNNVLSNEVAIHIDKFYPGMDKYTKNLEIYNNGDIDAIFSYEISYFRILNDVINVENQIELYDIMSHNYPFSFNVDTDSSYISSGESIGINIVIDWPLDSGNDLEDSNWGKATYNFFEAEKIQKEKDSNYVIRPAIEIVLRLNTKQYIEEENVRVSDNAFLLGASYNLNINTLKSCEEGSNNCHKFYVLDNNNLITDDTVTFIMDTNSAIGIGEYNFIMSLENDNFIIPSASKILLAVSKDITDTNIVYPNRSNRVLGNLGYNERADMILSDVSSSGGYFIFNDSYFNNLKSSECYWTNTLYSEGYAYAIKNTDNGLIMMYKENINNNCKFVPIVKIPKENILF